MPTEPNRQLIDLTGVRFGMLTAISEAERWPRAGRRLGRRQWLCRCDCGNETIVLMENLVTENTSSCGCAEGRWTHGMSTQPLFPTWCAMIYRCYSTGHEAYAHYGGRGIGVCNRWRDSFEAFVSDMGPKPSESHSLDRIDNDGDYEPNNCRWATPAQQARNTSRSVMLTMHGETLCQLDWAARLGLSRTTILARLRRGWSIEDAVTRPSQSRR